MAAAQRNPAENKAENDPEISPETTERRGPKPHRATGKPRGRPPSENVRTMRMIVWLSAEELLAIDRYASRSGYGAPKVRVARFMRACALRQALSK